jgi:hypothetical protein
MMNYRCFAINIIQNLAYPAFFENEVGALRSILTDSENGCIAEECSVLA